VECALDLRLAKVVQLKADFSSLGGAGMEIHACDSDVDWPTCDVRSCCQRSCDSVDCASVGQVNSTRAHYHPIAGDDCFGEPGETGAAEFPEVVNATTLHTCDVQKCCEDPARLAQT
jgi:hypothetical protein